jgi:transposase
MSQRDLKRLHVIRKAIDKRLRQHEAAELLALSQRQIRRLVKRIREESDKGIVHRLRGKASHRAIDAATKHRILALCRDSYAGFNPTFASEKLFEREKITISRETLRQWFIAEGIAYQKRKARPHRQWRVRKAHCGQMVQIDGSHHDWFEGRRARCVLMGYIDDATSRVFARFYEYEGTMPAMSSFKYYCLKYGLPQSLYLDRHPTYKGYKTPSIEDELFNRQVLSQFGIALEALGVYLIHAQSAPAKGRIERLFKTLQDRLVKEMRLRDIRSIPEANKFLGWYLPLFNRKFGVVASQSEDLHRPLPDDIELDKILTIKTERALRNDFTVVHEGKLYQIEELVRADKVMIEERLNGSFFITYKGRYLRYRQITQRPQKIQEPRKPHSRHPASMGSTWRMFRLPGSHKTQISEKIFANAL